MPNRNRYRHIRFLPTVVVLTVLSCCHLFDMAASAHEGHTSVPANSSSEKAPLSRRVAEADQYFQLFTTLVAQWPNVLKDELIAQAVAEHQVVHGNPGAMPMESLRSKRTELCRRLENLLPAIHVDWNESSVSLRDTDSPLRICRSLTSPLLTIIHNHGDQDLTLRAVPIHSYADEQPPNYVRVAAGSEMTLLTSLCPEQKSESLDRLEISLEQPPGEGSRRSISVPVTVVEPAVIRGIVREGDRDVPGRVTVQCQDGVCRYGGEFATHSTFTDKPIIYPPIGTWQKTTFFYTAGRFEMKVPPGRTSVEVQRGFEHLPSKVEMDLNAGEIRELELECNRIVDMAEQGWISGDTHVHWVTNAWNVDEPLELLAMVQRAEDLRVANNLTLLQRYANQAFIKPSQSSMGPVAEFSNSQFHVQMGEEYRNEDLYGHLCFLNIDWLVQPIGTGSIIAGPDSLDYPINRTAIDACRDQGGISIEAHGTGGNKDVPVNVIHNATDSLDQMEPEMYYRLLDCGFRLPLTNGSDHPARTLGIARAYVKVDGPFTYAKWIEGIRRGRTFTTSGPLLFLNVNDAEIGDVIHTGATDNLRIKAKVISRHPIGRFQIVSNGKVLAEKVIDGLTSEIELSIAASESRWIVARCSNRTDGRSEFGFGDFNVITGPGVAHTSPVYVQVDARPRLDPAAAQYWAERMRMHAVEIAAKGRFANVAQQDEAVDYIEQGVAMFRSLGQQTRSARSRDESLQEAKERLANVVRRFGNTRETESVLRAISECDSQRTLSDALAPLTWLAASVNPESRVKISAKRERIELLQGRPQRFLIQLENTAGITAPLGIQAIDITADPPQAATWCDIRVIDSPFSSVYCTGAVDEFKVVEILVHEEGLREVRLVADVGQGTQDLGFRATADIQIHAEPRRAHQSVEN
ncbi:CehA/McbA family metallohydrolase [Stieleria varia]|uniref:Uncharacterized protein n=1 Tax=Stieleria varia TaxID=2528005 RepID=A0A5C6B3N4_9BACT|nr:CehA/McbA family metallohydrolase [Stieleria varia]TWU06367.1 hypothetical protein Pla52n_20880 [Stieleria varia]